MNREKEEWKKELKEEMKKTRKKPNGFRYFTLGFSICALFVSIINLLLS